ncbi:MAG: hypothetical protein AB8H86_31470 [Polyangiales bacterium]
MITLGLITLAGALVLAGGAFLSHRASTTKVSAKVLPLAARRFLEAKGCPVCGASVTELLKHFQAYRCPCAQVFASHGTVSPEVETAVALFAEVRDGEFPGSHHPLLRKHPHLHNMQTASQRAYWLRETSVARALDIHGTLFAAARRQLAAAYGRREPTVEGKPAGYRDGEPTPPADVQSWSKSVPRDGLLGADALKIDAKSIRFGQTKVARADAKFFSIQKKSDPLRYDICCAFGSPLKIRRFVTIDEDALPKMEELIVEMEGVLGWLEVE